MLRKIKEEKNKKGQKSKLVKEIKEYRLKQTTVETKCFIGNRICKLQKTELLKTKYLSQVSLIRMISAC